MRDFVMEALGYVSPEAQALRLLGSQNKTFENFNTEAQIVTREANTNLLGNPTYRFRVWKTVLQAHQAQRMLARVSPNAVSHQLARLCTDEVKFGNEKILDLAASPVRYEPMIIAIPHQGFHVASTLNPRNLRCLSGCGCIHEKSIWILRCYGNVDLATLIWQR